MDCGRIVTTLPAPSNYCHAYRAQRGGSSSCSRLPAAGHAVDELFDLAEESHGLRLGVVRGELLEFGEQLALLLGEVLRRLHRDLDVHVAALLGPQHRHALAGEPEAPAGLRAFRDF